MEFTHYPFTHSLVGALLWGILFGLIYFFIKRNVKTSVLLGALVPSHWLLDLLVHYPDLPLFPGGQKVGMGLWNSVIATLVVEGLVFVTGALVYLLFTKAVNKRGVYSLWGLLISLFFLYFMNLIGPPPPSKGPVAVVGLSTWLFVVWGYWIDRNRKPKHNLSR